MFCISIIKSLKKFNQVIITMGVIMNDEKFVTITEPKSI